MLCTPCTGCPAEARNRSKQPADHAISVRNARHLPGTAAAQEPRTGRRAPRNPDWLQRSVSMYEASPRRTQLDQILAQGLLVIWTSWRQNVAESIR
ncbi:hypothetical protein BAUCODRAFT_36651 [Baudoinia panamericana UAMH 10762]|uniref:Uncharacterized protein n=1 Tax=Baudoinia panamericana (strain UAMH 10762) TaxID=717646 RepID=M2MRR1_BAUPA|nr:uncharacterized protein BAUCODRAFT_36651 [Baudoinia panamericana UAMH 10762]EMC94178.1 hypothetical protein BAUCODRAFT_36651 [Baudoinia panamericana UAMH 10762]